MTQKIKCALIGPGNIGTDLLYKLKRSPFLDPVWMIGIDPESEGLKRAAEMGLKTCSTGVDGFLPHVLEDNVQIAFDATSAYVHAENSRKLMMAYVEQMKFAVEKTLGMRQQAMSEAIAYINALATGPAMAGQIVGTGYDAQSKLISSVSSFYNARTDANRLVKQAEQFNVTAKFTKDEKNTANDLRILEESVKLMLTEAQAIAQMATSMFNNLHASAGVSSGQSVSPI